jgi:hypothetical protein
MMTIATLLNLLNPALPFLVGLASKVGEGASQSIGTDIWNQMKAKLSSKLAGHEIAKPAIEQLKQEPENVNLTEIVQVALKDLLEKDQVLADELMALLEDVPETSGVHVEQVIGSMTSSKAVANISNIKGNVSL